MPAAQVDALRVHVEHPVPGIRLGVEHGRVVGGHDPGVVVEHVDAAVPVHGCRVHRLHALGIGDVDLLEERLAAGSRRLLAGLGTDVGDADRRALLGEQLRRLAADPAPGAGDHDDLAVEPAHQSVETYRFFTSE